jgi:hypothetical protein
MSVTPATTDCCAQQPPVAFQLRFDSLYGQGRGYVFPCDVEGRIDLDALSPRGLDNYLYARAVVGRELCVPRLVTGRPA